jgi:hypothetical protein
VFNNTSYGDWTRKQKSLVGCSRTHFNGCFRHKWHISLCKKTFFFDKVNRACVPRHFCENDTSFYPNGADVANLHGCTIRALLEPTPLFRQAHVSFTDGRHGKKSISLSAVEAYLARYFVIAIHFRATDKIAFLHTVQGEYDMTAGNRIFLRPFLCAETIQSHLEQRSVGSHVSVVNELQHAAAPTTNEHKVNGKHVRWLVASDSAHFRELAQQLFGDKLLLVELTPEHIDHLAGGQRSREVLVDTFAEWYMLGLADMLVTNQYEDGDENFNLYSNSGRVSGYSKSAWTYNLKSVYYDAGTCRRGEMLPEGSWEQTPLACKKKSVFGLPIEQPHLQPLTANEFAFPEFWISQGQITRFHDVVAQTNSSLINGTWVKIDPWASVPAEQELLNAKYKDFEGKVEEQEGEQEDGR